uniref:CIDE-N domain-containing protein n=1 Tax=Magallana gigas TaxID=29159 RepID=A0A8W8P389_MAGGI
MFHNCYRVQWINQGGSGSKWLKVWTKDQTIKKATHAGCYNELVEKNQDNIQCWDGYGHQICVFKEDGTEVDEEYFEVLLNNTILMVLKSGELLATLGSQVTKWGCSCPSYDAFLR